MGESDEGIAAMERGRGWRAGEIVELLGEASRRSVDAQAVQYWNDSTGGPYQFYKYSRES